LRRPASIRKGKAIGKGSQKKRKFLGEKRKEDQSSSILKKRKDLERRKPKYNRKPGGG